MGKADIVTKDYMGDAEIFADLFNYYMYGGSQVIDPANLKELDPVELGVLYGRDGAGKLIQEYRDLLKYASVMADRRAVYLLLGLENQDFINYAMPVKNMSYDSVQYVGQVSAIRKKHRKEKDYAGRSSGEYLSGFYREDRLLPVITLVLYFGPDRWDGPLSLHEMLSVEDPRILSLVQDYKIHLIEPAALGPEDFRKLKTSLREVLSFIKYSRDKEKLRELLKADGRFCALDREAALVIGTCTNMEIKVEEGMEECNVCKAVDDLMEESREEGIKIGREKERANTERERKEKEREKKRADSAEAELKKLREELERYKRGA